MSSESDLSRLEIVKGKPDGVGLNTVLMIAFHFPPFKGSSGIQRTLKFARYLPEYGWAPIVLSAHPRAYPSLAMDQLREIPPTVQVHRAFALDCARHASLCGWYPRALALPDRWVSWWLGGVIKGMQLIKTHRPKVLYSTYPIATAHLIGMTLARLTGIPWIADFRDPMTEGLPGKGYSLPSDPLAWRAHRWVEQMTLKYCTRAVFVSPGAQLMYQNRYPETAKGKWALIPNGFDEEAFAAAERYSIPGRKREWPVTLIHSGLLYPMEGDRNPRAFFEALSKLKVSGRISAKQVKIVLRASGSEAEFQQLIELNQVEDMVTLAPAVPYMAALQEMLTVDGLLLFQGPISNPNIPAKLYEYLRAGKPILAMVDSAGDTAGVLRSTAVGTITPIDSATRITTALMEFLDQIRIGSAPVATRETIALHSRQARTQQLATLFVGVGCEGHAEDAGDKRVCVSGVR